MANHRELLKFFPVSSIQAKRLNMCDFSLSKPSAMRAEDFTQRLTFSRQLALSTKEYVVSSGSHIVNPSVPLK